MTETYTRLLERLCEAGDRNILTWSAGARGAITLLRRSPITPNQQQWLDIAQTTVERIRYLVTARLAITALVLELPRAEMPKDIPVADIVAEASAAIDDFAQRYTVTIQPPQAIVNCIPQLMVGMMRCLLYQNTVQPISVPHMINITVTATQNMWSITPFVPTDLEQHELIDILVQSVQGTLQQADQQRLVFTLPIAA
jgi:hypothetical protein